MSEGSRRVIGNLIIKAYYQKFFHFSRFIIRCNQYQMHILAWYMRVHMRLMAYKWCFELFLAIVFLRFIIFGNSGRCSSVDWFSLSIAAEKCNIVLLDNFVRKISFAEWTYKLWLFSLEPKSSELCFHSLNKHFVSHSSDIIR